MLKDFGNVIGFILSFIYTLVSVGLGYLAYNTKKEGKVVDIQLYITIFVLMLIVLIDLGYYLKNKNDPNKKKVNENVGTIALIPLILSGIRYGGPFIFMLAK